MRTISLSTFTLEMLRQELGHLLTRSRDESLWSGLEQTPLTDVERATLVVSAERLKRFHAQDPMAQCVGSILAVAMQRLAAAEAAEVFGCFTIADTWTFVRGGASRRTQGTPRG